MKKCAFIVCWFGEFPPYFDVWLKCVKENENFDFIIFTDAEYQNWIPQNVFIYKYTLEMLKISIKDIISDKISLNKPYRICDFRPLFGKIFSEYIKDYQFWGYCDLDIIIGDLDKFITDEMLEENEAIFNGGHMSLLKNNERMIELYRENGALFSYKTVIKHDAIFAFDEITGIQRISKFNNLKAIYQLPYIEADSKFKQITLRNSTKNFEHQAFYWENGKLFRVKLDNNEIYKQEYAYIHLQKRKIIVFDKISIEERAFWITPEGYRLKTYLGKPQKDDIDKYNPFEGKKVILKQKFKYYLNKLMVLLKRNPYQIFVRFKQSFAGINSMDHSMEDNSWEKF